jgi:hypothetical protein
LAGFHVLPPVFVQAEPRWRTNRADMREEPSAAPERQRPTQVSTFPWDWALAVFAGWLCAALGILGIPAEYESLFIRGLGFLAVALCIGIPVVWRSKHTEALARYVQTEGLYQGLDAANRRLEAATARDLHETFLSLCQIQRALNRLTREYHVKDNELWAAEQVKNHAAAISLKSEMSDLQSRMVLEYGGFDWEILSVLHRLEQRGFAADKELVKAMSLGCSTITDIDAVAAGLHRMVVEVGPHAW